MTTKEQPLFLIFSLPTAETPHHTVSAAVDQLTVFSQENGGDWQVRFRDIPDRVWIPHPMSLEGITLPSPEGSSQPRAIYRRIDVDYKAQGRVYTKQEILTFSGYWQPWLPGLTEAEEYTRFYACRNKPLSPSPIQAITTVMKSWALGFFNKSTKTG